MAFPLAFPVAISAIQSLIKFRGRLDTILSLNKATEGLPFSLPPVPNDDAPHVEPMRVFFSSEAGQNILIIRGLVTQWRTVSPDPKAGNVQHDLAVLLQAYYEACDVTPKRLGPVEATNRAFVAKGPSKEMRLAYYVVESDRLSRNPAVTRVLLAAADTLLEFGADNAGLFVSNPRTRALLESLLTEFAVNRDWDDASEGEIFKMLLSSTVVAAMDNQGSLPDKPLLKVVFAALAEIKTTEGEDFVAKLMTRDGFQTLISGCLIHAADEPSLLPERPVLKESLVAMLRTAGNNLDGILNQPAALAGVLEAGIAAATSAAIPLVDVKISGQPLLAAVLKSTLDQTQKAADQQKLFSSIVDGAFFSSLYKVTLQSVAANPGALAGQAGLDAHVATLISAWTGELTNAPLLPTLSTSTLRVLAVRVLEVLATEPELLGARREFAAQLTGAALTSAAQAARCGFSTADLLEITDAVVRSAAANLGLVALDDRLKPIVTALARTFEEKGLSGVATAASRKAMFFAGLEALVANPLVWGNFAEKNLVEALVIAVIHAFATNPGNLLSGPALVPAFQVTLEAAARRGRAFSDLRTTPAALESVLTAALAAAEGAIGNSIDGKTLPQFLDGIVLSFLSAPFDPGVQQKMLTDLITQRLATVA